MTDIATFPTLTLVLHNDGPTFGFIAGADIKAGQVVAFATTGVSYTVHPAIAGTTAQPIGVAIIPAAAGAPVTVALVGSIVTVVNADDATAIDAGEAVADDDNTVGGTVAAAATTATGYAIGVTIEDIPKAGSGKIIVMPQIITKAAT